MPTWDRVDRLGSSSTSGHIDAASLDENAKLNELLWENYGKAEAKALEYEEVREHLGFRVHGPRPL